MRIGHPTRAATRGFNLIEAAIVLGVIGLVLGGIWISANALRTRMQMADIQSMVVTARAGAQNLFRSQCLSASNLTDTLHLAGLVPASSYDAGNVAVSLPWTGSYMQYLTGGGVSCTEEFWVDMYNLPVSPCIELVSRISSAVPPGDLLDIEVTGSGTTNLTTFPVSPAAATAACTDPTSNDVQFKLKSFR